ncbi:MAG: hypothetical protein K2Y14_01815 [Burkholderiales bacterium]|nr:hypothetical protein [Burkholderiales bacterium]
MMRIKTMVSSLILITLLGGCSMFGNNPTTVPQPPKTINNSDQILLPQIGNSTQSSVSESAAAHANESQATRFKTITETRTPGGGVSKVNVDNPAGGMPDYYLAPSQLPTDTNNNPDKLSPPSWEWSW